MFVIVLTICEIKVKRKQVFDFLLEYYIFY